ncbi:MAG: hypothetical protein HKM28_04765, partial [Flavobacteriaceae bacterium]|nr:hypothetical protein [Flavobacteriaceae bacterium]
IASLVAIVVMVPSVWLFINLLDEQLFETRTKEFVRDVVQYDGAEIVKFSQDYKTKNLDIYLIGRPVPQTVIADWITELQATEKLEETNLRVYQGTDQSGELAEKISGDLKTDILSELYVNNEQRIRDKNDRIDFLEEEIAKMKIKEQGIPFKEVSKELKIAFEGLESFAYSKQIVTNFNRTDTLPVFQLSWNNRVRQRERESNRKKIQELLKVRLQLDTLRVVEDRN